MLRTASFELAPGLLTLDQAKQDEPLHRPLPPLTSPPDGAGTGITLAALSNWTLRRIGELVADATPPPPSAEKKPVPVEAKSKPVKPAAVAAEPEEKKSDPISRITDRVKGLFKRNRSSDDTKSGGGG
jgi:hypothetical protein